MRDPNLKQFLAINNYNELLDTYRLSRKEEQQMLNNIYKASYRFALTKSQTKYLLEEAIRPFDKGKDIWEELL